MQLAVVEASPDKPSPGFKALLTNHDYSRLWAGQLVSNIGTAISRMALLFFVYALTQSALAMAILAILQVLPVVLFSGFIGVYVDRFDRKKIMVVSDVTRTIIILLIPLSLYLPTFVPTVYYVYLFTFLYATADAWFFPARSASIPNLVEKEELVAANSLSQMTYQIVTLTIPPLGGILIAFLAPDYFLAFVINAAAFVFSASALWSIEKSLKPEATENDREPLIHQMADGARVVKQNIVLSYLFLFAMLVAVSSGILNALLLPHLEGDLGLGEIELGFLMAGGAGLGILIAIIMSRRERLPKPLSIATGAGLIAGVSVVIFAVATNFIGAFVAWCIIGAVDVMFAIPLSTLMQELVEDKMRGRVFSLLGVVFTTFQVAGMAIGGVWAEVVGSSVQPLYFSGVGFAVAAIIGFLLIGALKLHSRLDIMLASSGLSPDVVARTTGSEDPEVLLEVSP